MNSDVTIELTKAIRKLYTLEDSIIYEDKIDHRDLRSKQALLISEVIQSLQELESDMKRDPFLRAQKEMVL
ncbi:hypothetical protein CSA56_14840 [candidate division KSB3 bacterium]|uniref:Uncharacterized protein n=1 Tax=candidate division KSB3 bacterium TaxID=2044937 RepID=A0A2G6KB39_9BACT|nr:MAG: hypothetical protein CSA56_14840 [candidate division KSB3 bacterium]